MFSVFVHSADSALHLLRLITQAFSRPAASSPPKRFSAIDMVSKKPSLLRSSVT